MDGNKVTLEDQVVHEGSGCLNKLNKTNSGSSPKMKFLLQLEVVAYIVFASGDKLHLPFIFSVQRIP